MICAQASKRVKVMMSRLMIMRFTVEMRFTCWKYANTALKRVCGTPAVHLKLALAWGEVMADWDSEGEVAGAARPRMEAGAAFGDRSSDQV